MKIARLLAILILGLAVTGCKTKLYGGLSERDANEIVMVLAEKGIAADRSADKGGGMEKEALYSVSVDNDSIGTASALLMARGLPRQKYESFGTIFQGSQMVASPFEEHVRYTHALNQELARSISSIPGVINARVHIMLPESSPLQAAKQHPRASVFVYHNPSADLTDKIPVIKMQMVNSIDDMNYEDVSVALFPDAQLTETAAATAPGKFSSFLSLIIFGVAAVGLFLLLKSKIPVRSA